MDKIKRYIRHWKRFYRRKKKAIIATASVFFLGVACILFLEVSANYKIPDIYLRTEGNGTATALTGSYEWRYGYNHVLADALHPTDMTYDEKNILTTERDSQIVISPKETEESKEYPFTVVSFILYDNTGAETKLDKNSYSVSDGDITINSPRTNGEYIYDLQLKYKRGEVEYGLKVIVTDSGSRTKILYANKTSSVDEKDKVGAIIDALNLPASSTGLTSDGFSVKTKPDENDILVKYKAEPAVSDFYRDLDNPSLFRKNAIILFSLIENASLIRFNIACGAESFDISYTRQEAEFYMKKDMDYYAKNEERFTAMYEELGASLIVTTYYLQAQMKGLELYVWKNKKVTGSEDAYFTLLIGTNRAKKESEIYDLSAAVKDIKTLNSMLARYKSETYLAVFQMNKTDFTKADMEAVTGKIIFPAANFSASIGLWEKADAVTVKGDFPIANHNHFFSFDGKDFTPETTFMFMAEGVDNLDKSTYFDIEAFCFYARNLSGLTENQIQNILDYDKTITVGEIIYINLTDLRKLGVNVAVGWQFSYGTPVSFYTANS